MKYDDAVASQPANLESTLPQLDAALRAADLTPWRTGSVAVVAMGANSHAGWVLVELLRRAGRPALNVSASALLEDVAPAAFADAYVLVSEGGRSRETVGAAMRLPAGRRLGLTNVSDSPLSHAVDVAVTIGHGEDSPVYTVGYTATLQAFGALAGALGISAGSEDLAALPELLRHVLATGAAPMDALAESFARLTSIDFVGRGASFASAAESALLFREATRTPTAAFETHQYLHGPMEALAADRGCVLFGDDREVELAGYLAERAIPVLLVANAAVASSAAPATFSLPTASLVSRAVLEIAPLQQLAGAVARRKGLPIEGFVHHQHDTKLPAPE